MTDMRKKKIKIKEGGTVVPPAQLIPDALFQMIQKRIPVACVDLLILRKVRKGGLDVLLVKRKIYPEQKKWCFIGGRILKNERTKDTIKRQAKRELGISVRILPPWNEVTPFAVFNDPLADPQKHFIVLTFPVIITKGKFKIDGPEFSDARWFPLKRLPSPLGFHHKEALRAFSAYAKKRLPLK